MDSFGSYLIIGISFSIMLVLVIVFIYLFYESFMEQKFRVAKLAVFLVLIIIIFFNNFYASNKVGEDIDQYCSLKSGSFNFLLSESYRNCILNSDHRNILVDKDIKNASIRLNKIREKWLLNFKVDGFEFMSLVRSIGVDKFSVIDKKLPTWGWWSDETAKGFPSLVKVDFIDCHYGVKRQVTCFEQLTSKKTKIGGVWTFKAPGFPIFDWNWNVVDMKNLSVYLKIPTKRDFGSEISLIGFNLSEAHINETFDKKVQNSPDYFNQYR